MAYLHCHSCDWSQDDFYTKGYNPLTKIWDDIGWTIKPRRIEFDDSCINDMKKYCYTPIIAKVTKRGLQSVFSLNWLIVEMERNIRSFIKMKWLTWDSWKKVQNKAVCPKCGDRNFDID